MALACEGWPLIRSPEALEHAHRYEHDFGGPESLALHIVAWEYLARCDGHVVRAPRLPGLEAAEALWSRDRS